jgi:GTP cyclohydrolase II
MATKPSHFTKVPKAKLPTRFGHFTIYGFKNPVDGEEAVALVAGKVGARSVPLVRIHSQCLAGDTLASFRCDCGEQLHAAMRKIAQSTGGILIYQQQEGRGIGLLNVLRTYALQDKGVDTVDANVRLGFAADARDYAFCAAILKHFHVRKVNLLSNNPHKISELERHGIKVHKRVPLEVAPSPSTMAHLQTKKKKLGHLLSKV